MSKSQLFKSLVPLEPLYELLEKICVNNDTKFYILSKTSYNSGKFNNLIEPFCMKYLDFYHDSKKKYIERKMDYNRFITIIRQICSINNIFYEYKISYNKSSYDIVYYISKEIIPPHKNAIIDGTS
jgi:hypothetical protein